MTWWIRIGIMWATGALIWLLPYVHPIGLHAKPLYHAMNENDYYEIEMTSVGVRLRLDFNSDTDAKAAAEAFQAAEEAARRVLEASSGEGGE